MIRTIRPWQLFVHLNGNRDILYRIPSHKGQESMTIMSLETLALISVVRITGAKTILELGTGLGYNALNLSRNTDARIVTVDREQKPRVFTESARISVIHSDIDDYLPLGFTPDLVFCDINFTPETTARATEIAFSASPRVIAWHDYGHPDHPHVKEQLDALAETHDLIHIGDTWMVFWFRAGFEAPA